MGTATTVEEIGQVIGVRATSRRRGWLEYVVDRRMKRALEKARSKRTEGAYADGTPEERARSVVLRACVKAACTGALSGAASSAALVATVETDGVASVVALPLAALAIGGEMATRAVFHVDLACELAEIFSVPTATSEDVIRLMSLATGDVEGEKEEEEDLGQTQMRSATVDREALFEHASNLLLGESVLRNVLPFIGIVSSALTNVLVTRRLGRLLRRSFRYERAMTDALRDAAGPCADCMDLLVEGLWFVFIADGRLSAEETACLAQRLDDVDEERRRRLLSRFTADETDWLSRLRSVPPEAREKFLHVLEVAAGLDKSFTLPEDKLVRRVADTFQLPHDPARVREIVRKLEETGVLT